MRWPEPARGGGSARGCAACAAAPRAVTRRARFLCGSAALPANQSVLVVFLVVWQPDRMNTPHNIFGRWIAVPSAGSSDPTSPDPADPSNFIY